MFMEILSPGPFWGFFRFCDPRGAGGHQSSARRVCSVFGDLFSMFRSAFILRSHESLALAPQASSPCRTDGPRWLAQLVAIP
eukprot:2161266-Prymnesium_polylepis.2